MAKLVILFFVMTTSLFAQDTLKTHSELFESKYISNHSLQKDEEQVSLIVKSALFTVNIYQNYLGRIKGSYCPMYPSCSNYGQEAIQKFKVSGVLMTFDRLHRCSHDLDFYTKIILNNKIKYYDPPLKY